MEYKLYFDGGSRGNPGESGAGFCLKGKKESDPLNGGDISNGYIYLGIATNNEAEWSALIHGLKEAVKLGIKELQVFGDSKLVINQVQDKWKVKAENLKKFHVKAKNLLPKFSKITFEHILRNLNKEADMCANIAMDTKKSLIERQIIATKMAKNKKF
jgi:ribonuclease HI